ncbi:hypothetical protein SCHPADRAFT_482061 [Schizopora paradoxa]|uniref:F-box domain-containing protein n=1 Tax=Schizopora paradoxa TaxID=27342 RepID=A0A0H2RH25_9AGAM|nr:hypothetical protein SCHPADRAFT_482061 [Schizopora paradoxa]
MTSKGAADACFNISDIILLISAFIDTSEKTSLSFLSRTNRCAYLSLEQERGQVISCSERNTPSLFLFLERLIQRYDHPPCRSLEVIRFEQRCYDDPENHEADFALASILNRIRENSAFDSFAYRTNQPQGFFPVSPAIWNALHALSGNLRSLSIVSHPCDSHPRCCGVRRAFPFGTKGP